jgi:L-lactate dehydrogenase complex protein LldG
MTSTAKNNILGRLKKFRQPPVSTEGQNDMIAANAADVLATELTASIKLAPGSILTPEQKTERFTTAIETAHGEIVRTTTTSWLKDLHEHLLVNNVTSLLYAPNGGVGGSQMGTELAGHDFGDIQLIPFAQPVETFKDDLFNKIDAGISYASSAVAHTGTLIVKTGPDEPRTMSLVPPVHYVWLDSKSMYSNLTEAFADPEVSAVLPTNLLLISGPSKTADIQQTLAYGAHGPKRLIILLVE